MPSTCPNSPASASPTPIDWRGGAFVGLTVRHGRPHMTRAVLEGVACGLRDSFELIKAAGGASVEQVRVSGGGAKTPFGGRSWRTSSPPSW